MRREAVGWLHGPCTWGCVRWGLQGVEGAHAHSARLIACRQRQRDSLRHCTPSAAGQRRHRGHLRAKCPVSASTTCSSGCPSSLQLSHHFAIVAFWAESSSGGAPRRTAPWSDGGPRFHRTHGRRQGAGCHHGSPSSSSCCCCCPGSAAAPPPQRPTSRRQRAWMSGLLRSHAQHAGFPSLKAGACFRLHRPFQRSVSRRSRHDTFRSSPSVFCGLVSVFVTIQRFRPSKTAAYR